ncbi:MAG: aminodeoxychorismate lyase [Gammaproteobacteria bacterium RIFCSPLOWO2_02_FULL_57_10]|nr:MAG: aminodeoxychorismate lyase [Gammaproteobacteria bacterium RIFCSPLOWO2_02_FULL_57_10]
MLVNGQAQSHLSLADRALHYGDGVFETIRVRDGKPALWHQHLARLTYSCDRLEIPLATDQLEREVALLLSNSPSDGILKIIVSRGCGGRGYMPPESPSPTRIVQFHSLPADYENKAIHGIRAMVCNHPISSNSALAGIKHLNRLDQVMASMELRGRVDEGLMCDASGHLIEGIKSNVFVVTQDRILTPDLTSSGVAGIMRAVVIDLLSQMKMQLEVRSIELTELRSAKEVFVCNSVMGIWPVTCVEWKGEELRFNTDETSRTIQARLRDVF